MSGLPPRAPEDSVRPRRLLGASVRPLNFTVRRTRNRSPLALVVSSANPLQELPE